MGFLIDEKENGSSEGSGDRPWGAESGTYPADVVKVDITEPEEDAQGRKGEHPVYNLTFRLDHVACKAPQPFDAPDVVLSLDTNKEHQRRVLYRLIGTPMADDKTGAVYWDSSGAVQWNGRTDEGSRFSGKFPDVAHVEVKIDAKPPNRKQKGNGYWPAKYFVLDVGEVGEAQSNAESAAAKLVALAKRPPAPTATTADHTPPAPRSARKAPTATK